MSLLVQTVGSFIEAQGSFVVSIKSLALCQHQFGLTCIDSILYNLSFFLIIIIVVLLIHSSDQFVLIVYGTFDISLCT